MRKIKEILRLHFEQKLGQRQIARSANLRQSTVKEYLAQAKAAALGWPLGEEWEESRRALIRRDTQESPGVASIVICLMLS